LANILFIAALYTLFSKCELPNPLTNVWKFKKQIPLLQLLQEQTRIVNILVPKNKFQWEGGLIARGLLQVIPFAVAELTVTLRIQSVVSICTLCCLCVWSDVISSLCCFACLCGVN
jgi:hypothetical protein